MKTEQLIVSALVNVKEFKQKTLPYIKDEFFENQSARVFFNIVKDYEAKYKDVPNESAFEIELGNLTNLNQETFEEVEKLKEKAFSSKVKEELNKANIEWLVDTTETHCKERAVYNAVLSSVEIISGETKKPKEGIPSMLQDALNVSFKPTLGHDYIRDWEERFEIYHSSEDRIPFPLTMLNKTTKGGLPRKCLAVPIAPTGVGKSMFLTHHAGWWITQGYNVLYVTLEMAYDKIGERIDASLLNWSLDDIASYPKETFRNKLEKLKTKSLGRLIIEEYPTGSFSAMNLRALLDELKTKESFEPDIVCVDYLGIMKPVRGTGADNSYTAIKNIAEELRSVAMERELLIFAPHQTNRCLSLDTLVDEKVRGLVRIDSLEEGNEIKGSDGYVRVNVVFPKEINKVYEIRTNSGKTVRCSSKHIFPTSSGMKSIDSGLKVGDVLFSEE